MFNNYGYNKYVYLRRDNGNWWNNRNRWVLLCNTTPINHKRNCISSSCGDGTQGSFPHLYLNPRFQVFETFVSRSAFLGDLLSTSQSYDEGQVIVSTGVSGSGYIRMNANPRDSQTPYIDIVERTGSGLYDQQLKVRLGDLTGLETQSMCLKVQSRFGLQ